MDKVYRAQLIPDARVRVGNMNRYERQAWFIYEAARLAALASKAPIVPEPWELRDWAFRSQFIEVIKEQIKKKFGAELLHEKWIEAYKKMGWRYGSERDPVAKTHPDMVPYAELEPLERDKDEVFVALCEIARQWIY